MRFRRHAALVSSAAVLSVLVLTACQTTLGGGDDLGIATSRGPLYARTEVVVDVDYRVRAVSGPFTLADSDSSTMDDIVRLTGYQRLGLVHEDGAPLRMNVSGHPMAAPVMLDGTPIGPGRFRFEGDVQLTFRSADCPPDIPTACSGLPYFCEEETRDTAPNKNAHFTLELTLRDADNRPVSELSAARRVHGSVSVRIPDIHLRAAGCVPGIELQLDDSEFGEDLAPLGHDGSPIGADAGTPTTTRADAGTSTTTTRRDAGTPTTSGSDAGSASASPDATGENGDSCAGVEAETWRCVFSPSWGTTVSQVCRGGIWINYHLHPRDCDACNDAASWDTACTQDRSGTTSTTTTPTGTSMVADHLPIGEHGDSCRGVREETWRCSFSNYWESTASQVCRDNIWTTFHLQPRECLECGPGFSVACRQEGH